MTPDEPPQSGLTALLDRVRAGDAAARDHLFRAAQTRLEDLARRMLARQPAVRRWAETGDVFQNAALRLVRALEGTPVSDTREFFNLAAAVIRRELIDMARHFLGSRRGPPGSLDGHPEPAAPALDTAGLDRWAALHEAVERLPPEQREVFGLTLYHGWTQPQIAELFGVDERTVRRRWRAAVEALHQALGGAVPED
jgi:RNA polymerase sigma-70 factor (ECF subfamily)